LYGRGLSVNLLQFNTPNQWNWHQIHWVILEAQVGVVGTILSLVDRGKFEKNMVQFLVGLECSWKP